MRLTHAQCVDESCHDMASEDMAVVENATNVSDARVALGIVG